MFKAAPTVRTMPAVLTIAAFAASSALGQFYSMGRLPDGTGVSSVTGLSSDGRTASGTLRLGLEVWGFTWDAQSGRNDFGLRPGGQTYSTTTGISGDGRFVIGGMSGGPQAYRWSESDGFEALGVPAGWASSFATDINGDGSVIVGELHDSSGNFYQPFRWTNSGGMQFLRRNGNLINATVKAISSDGQKVVGSDLSSSRGYVWTERAGYQLLPLLDGTTGPSSSAWGISANGEFIVGMAGEEHTGALWTSAGAINLGMFAGYRNFVASEVSDSGEIVAGTSSGNPRADDVATVWTQLGGIQTLSDYLADQGVTLPIGVALFSITDMSADGRTFAGSAWIPGDSSSVFGYVVTVPAPASACTLLGLLVCCRRKRG